MFVTRLALTLACILLPYSIAAQVPVPMASQPDLTFTEDFFYVEFWANNFASGIGANRFSSVLVNSAGPIPNGLTTTQSTNVFVAGESAPAHNGVQKGGFSGNPVETIVLYAGGTSSIAAVAIDFHMDFTAVEAGTLSFDWQTVVGGVDRTRTGSLRVYWSVNGATFTEIPAAAILNKFSRPDSGTVTTVELPDDFDNVSTARLRFYQHADTGGDAGGRPKFSIDNLTVTAVSPSAAPVSIGGLVTTADGRAVSGARLRIEGGNLKSPRWALTNPFGRFRFEGLEPGMTYIISVGSKRFTFAEPVRAVTPQENISDLTFTSMP